MTARDRWTVDLHCPKCGKSGTAHVYQEDGWSFSNGDQSTHVESIPDGFTSKNIGKSGLKFFCSECAIEAR